jgi:hypothetical protein
MHGCPSPSSRVSLPGTIPESMSCFTVDGWWCWASTLKPFVRGSRNYCDSQELESGPEGGDSSVRRDAAGKWTGSCIQLAARAVIWLAQ